MVAQRPYTPVSSLFIFSHFFSFNYFSISATANVRFTLIVPHYPLSGGTNSRWGSHCLSKSSLPFCSFAPFFFHAPTIPGSSVLDFDSGY
ncbi:unnamed protein product [Citrullus colocynthis]|uniref:Secreted protein n=1 Tax=Citrullus colocynthis TaxID=252529 RepID=A0ABP0YG29_9ROSI